MVCWVSMLKRKQEEKSFMLRTHTGWFGGFSGSRSPSKIIWLVKGSLTRDFRLQVFSWISVPQAPKYFMGPFWIFSKIRGDITNEYLSSVSTTPAINCSAVSMTPAKNLLPVSLTMAINPCHGEITKKPKIFSPGSTTLPKNCSPVSTTPPINYSAVSTTPAIKESCQY